jgi:hypothetical protein
VRGNATREAVALPRARRGVVVSPSDSAGGRHAASGDATGGPRLVAPLGWREMSRWLTSLALVAALAVAACGEDKEETYKEDFPAVNDKIVALGTDVAKTIRGASTQSDEQIEKEFGEYAQRMGDLQQEADELEPPDDLKSDQDDLTGAMGDIQGSLENIEKAAGDGDANAARQATLQLVRSSAQLREARRKLAKATGAKVGS